MVNDMKGPTRIFELMDEGYRSVGPLMLDAWTEELAAHDMCAAEDRVFLHSARRDKATVHPRGLPTEYILGVHALEPGFVLLQTGYYERPFPDQEWHMVRRRTYLLDRATGNGGLVSDNLPRILWIGDASFVAAWSDPYAKVEVRALPNLQP